MSSNPSFFYTLIAYREDGVDTCRGCVMDRSSSAFSLESATDAETIAGIWATARFNEPEGREYCETEYTLLLNGRSPSSDPSAYSDDDSEVAEAAAYEAERLRVDQLVASRLQELQAEKAAAAARAAEVAAVKRAAAEREAIALQEARDRAEFVRLSQKFSGSSDAQ